MALLGNYSVINKSAGRYLSGATVADTRANWNKNGQARNMFQALDRKSSIPEGALAPTAWVLPQVTGGMSVRIFSGSTLNANVVMGRNCAADLSGTSSLSVSASSIVQIAAALFGTSSVTAGMVGVVSMAAALAGSGNMTVGLNMLVRMAAELSGSSGLAANLKGKAGMSADIFVNSGAATTNELVAAIWAAVASANNQPGTMGAKLNAASAAGDPWSAVLPGSYVSGEAGNILAQIQILVDELHKLSGLSPGVPMVVDEAAGTRVAGDIMLEIEETSTSTTVTRV